MSKNSHNSTIDESPKPLRLRRGGRNRHGQTWDDIFRDYHPPVEYANRRKEDAILFTMPESALAPWLPSESKEKQKC